MTLEMTLDKLIKYTLGFICVVWDDPRGVMRHLENPDILKFDFIYFCDGKFSQWSGKPEFPKYETRDIIQDWSDSNSIQVYYEMVDNKTESGKRSHSLERSYQLGMKWGLIIDSDEEFTLNRELFDYETSQNINRECHAIKIDNYNIPQRKPRLLDIKSMPFYKDNHSEIYSGLSNSKISETITEHNDTLESITIKHNKEFYSEYRFEQRNVFGATKH